MAGKKNRKQKHLFKKKEYFIMSKINQNNRFIKELQKIQNLIIEFKKENNEERIDLRQIRMSTALNQIDKASWQQKQTLDEILKITEKQHNEIEILKETTEESQKTAKTEYKTARLLSSIAILISLLIGGLQIYLQSKTDYTDIINNQKKQIEQLKLLNAPKKLITKK
jgi:hypothetical protein